MNPEYKIQDWIDRYLNNEMNDAEKLEFETQLSLDNDLQDAFKAQKVAHKIIIGEELLKLKAQMSKDMEGGNMPGGISNKTSRYIFIGATVLIIGAVLYFITGREDIAETERLNENTNFKILQETSIVPVDTAIQNARKEENSLLIQETIPSVGSNQNYGLKKQDPIVKKNLCTDSIINFSCQARGTCKHKNEGAIEIDLATIKSTKAPFLFSVSPNTGFQEESHLLGLKSGNYTLYVKDSKQCLHKLDVPVEVPTVHCEHNLPSK